MRRRDFLKGAGVALAAFIPTATVAGKGPGTNRIARYMPPQGKSWYDRSFGEVAQELNRRAHKGHIAWRFNGCSISTCLYSFRGNGQFQTVTEAELDKLLHRWDEEQGNQPGKGPYFNKAEYKKYHCIQIEPKN